MSSITKGDLSRAFNAFEGLEVVLFFSCSKFFRMSLFSPDLKGFASVFLFLTPTHSYEVFS